MFFGFRKLKFGFVNLMMLGLFDKEAEDIAIKYSEDAKEYISKELGIKVVDSGIAVADFNQARKTWQKFNADNVDAVILFGGTFSLSNLMIEIVRNLNLPFLVWGVEEFAINKGILSGSMCGLMPAGFVFKNLEKKFIFTFGNISNANTKKEVRCFVDAVRAITYLKESKIGLLGTRPDGFEITNFDELVIKKVFGTTIQKISIAYYLELIDSLNDEEINSDLMLQKEIFNIKETDLEKVKGLSKAYIALKKIISEQELQCYAPDCWPELRDKYPICVANSRCTSEGVMASCETDIDCALTMLMLYAITGNPPWTADFVNIMNQNDTLLFWHCGNAPHVLSKNKPDIEIIRNDHLSQTSSLKKGVATVCRINHYRGSFEIHAGIGEVIESEPMCKGSSLYIKMKSGNMEFVKSLLKSGTPHHNVIVYGDVSKELAAFTELMNLPIVII